MEQSKQVIPFFLIAIVVVAVVFFFNEKDDEPTPQTPIPVRTATISSDIPINNLVVSGTTKSAETALLRFQVGGRVEKKLVSLGQQVKAGDSLAVLYNPEIEPLAQQAKENFDRLSAEQAQASRDFERLESLYEQQAVTTQEWENGKTRLTAATKAVSAAKSALARSERVASELSLTAPFAGAVTEILTDVGEVVTAGAPAFRLSNPGRVELKIAVREETLSQVSLGQEISVRRSLSADDRKFVGTVTEISPFRERGALPELVVTLDGSEIAPGTTVTAELAIRADDRISIPIRSVLMTGENTTAVYQIENNVATLTPIRPLKITTSGVLIDQGLEPGDVVATEGIAQLFDGALVEVSR
ncbi:MAG: efflux RND transporter periplasmic adaptor subunit [Pseudomonadota bacterium]